MIKQKTSLTSIGPYVAGKPVEEVKRELSLTSVIKLASNENPYGSSKVARKACMQALDSLNIYPDANSYNLRCSLSARYNLNSSMFVFGTGSDGLIELICKTFLEPNDECIMPYPSFSLYEINTLASGAAAVKVPLNSSYAADLDEMRKAITNKTKIVWLCNPNNPTGGIYSGAEQQQFIENINDDILVVLDEAYFEYASSNKRYPNSQKLLKKHKNVIILRTFSKIYGLAGLRVGYGIADPNIIEAMNKVRAPFNVNAIAQAAAVASLEDTEFAENSVLLNEENKQYMYDKLFELGIPYIKSYANFIMINIKRDSYDIFNKLLKKGYIVKSGHDLGMNGFLRVTIGTKEECTGFIEALADVLSI